MKSNLFKNFKTLKQKEEEQRPAEAQEKVDNVSVEVEASETESKMDNVSVQAPQSNKEAKLDNVSENTLITEVLENNPTDDLETVSSSENKLAETQVIKKRPVKKELIEAKEAIASNNSTSYAKQISLNQSKKHFTIYLKPESYEFIKDLVFYKVTNERLIFYNQSEAFSEALQLMMPSYKSIQPRPDSIREQEKNKKGGRKRNSDETYDVTTSIYIPGEYFEFIKDVSYNQVIKGKMYFKDWDLIEEGIQKLRKKYGDNIQPRPDYIREDEKLRAKKPKAES